ncbi:glycosyl hydrolase [Hymenobacter nivis]|uniref:Glycosyl hydrolase n=2 Tax=Hymenobacter nivis TaxID=1850093 RepID=A0A2Z3GX93_9BACT|nr:glycosyl hydrolase [Hymenobacter nivis]
MPAIAWAARADSAQAALTQYFWDADKHYYCEDNAGKANYNYWWQAHGLDVLLDGYQRTKNPAYLAQMQQLQVGTKAQNHDTYLNEYYDDMEWQALACLRAFELTKDPAYRATAALLWANIKTGWNEQQGGGIAWRKTQLGYKNTPANAPAAILAARFYLLDHRAEDLAWAKKIYAWEKKTLVDPATGLVWDGVNGKGDGQIDKRMHFTYNQGVYIGAGLALYQATKQRGYLAGAERTAAYTLADPILSPNGILRNENSRDGGLFKGILVRYLTSLAIEPATSAASRASYARFLATNGQSLGQHATRRPQYLFGTSWAALPTDPVDASTEMSGVMLLEALAELQARHIL